MSIFETVGVFLVFLMFAWGVVVTAYLAIIGAISLRNTLETGRISVDRALDIGRMFKETALRDRLAKDFIDRLESQP